MTVNTSKPAKYRPGDLVKHDQKGTGIIEQTAHYSDISGIFYDVIFHRKVATGIPESHLRPLTFLEFLHYKDPATGGWKIGKNRAWPLYFANGIALFGAYSCIGGLHTDPSVWMGVALATCILVPVFTLMGTYTNWKGKQS